MNNLVDMLREAFNAGMSCAAAYEHGTYAVDFKKWHEENKSEIDALHKKLRCMSDISNDECIRLASILGGSNHISDSSKIYQVRELLKGIRTKQTNLPGIKWMEALRFLNNVGIDPFLPLLPEPPEDRVRYMTRQTTPKPPQE